MKKTLLLLLALLVLGGSNVWAKTLSVDLSALPATSENTTWTWDSETKTGVFDWSGTSWNSTELFGSGDYSGYTTLNLVTTDGTANHFRIIVKFSNGADQVTINPVAVGSVSLTLTDYITEANLGAVSTIRLSGANDVTGNVNVKNVYLEGPDPLYREVYALGNRITFAEALVSEDPFVMVQNGKVLCGPLSSSDNSLTFKGISEIESYSWTIRFEEDAENKGSYFMELLTSNGASKGFINASIWSHTYLSGVDKSGTKGELQNGALWTVTSTGNGKYTIKNLGVTEGAYNNKPNESDGDRAAQGQGYLAVTPTGYWANHVTIYNTSGEWEFYTLSTTQLPANDHLYYGWDNLTFTNNADVIVDAENHLVVDKRGYAPYWAETAKWQFSTPFDATSYRYMVFYAKRNVTKYGNEDNETGGTLFIKDNNGVTFRQDDFVKYNEINYPEDHIGKLWMNRWNEQRATVFDMQWLANTDKYGDGSECKALDITQIKEIGVAGTFTIGGIFFTNTLPAFSTGDYKRSFDSFDKFGTICLPYSAVCCGAQLYEIAGKSSNYIILSEYEGVMEAGKPYIYKTLEAIKQDGGFKDETEVYFFKAGYEQVDAPVANNGLLGTFTGTTAPLGENYYVLSNNALYQVNSEVTVGANKAYIDVSDITNVAEAKGRRVSLNFNDTASGVAEIENNANVKIANSPIYNLRGQRVVNPTKGIYIVNGKKVFIK